MKIIPVMCELVKGLPTPESTSYILVDMDPTQFLSDVMIVTGLVEYKSFIKNILSFKIGG